MCVMPNDDSHFFNSVKEHMVEITSWSPRHQLPPRFLPCGCLVSSRALLLIQTNYIFSISYLLSLIDENYQCLPMKKSANRDAVFSPRIFINIYFNVCFVLVSHVCSIQLPEKWWIQMVFFVILINPVRWSFGQKNSNGYIVHNPGKSCKVLFRTKPFLII